MKNEQERDDFQKEKERAAVKRGSFAIFVSVLLLFSGIMFVTFFFEVKFGKTAGTIALVVIAVIITIGLYWKEILAKLKK